jgi:hypothetical protein
MMDMLRDALMWESGAPKNKWFDEWFIAKLDNGQKVVLKRLPDEYSYDFKTADETYYKEFRVAKWMPFPESEFYSPTAKQLLEALELALVELIEKARIIENEFAGGGFVDAESLVNGDKYLAAIAAAKGE